MSNCCYPAVEPTRNQSNSRAKQAGIQTDGMILSQQKSEWQQMVVFQLDVLQLCKYIRYH